MSETATPPSTGQPATKCFFVLQIKDMSAFTTFPSVDLFESQEAFLQGAREYIDSRCMSEGAFDTKDMETLHQAFLEFLEKHLDPEVAGVFDPAAAKEWTIIQNMLYACTSERIQITVFLR